ncbi:unnamed protein product [Prorocentrum cordatum]|uniref:Uncharacterized protein n=1 Tax=Prorocentrum cordatum TaxID=2364126 RepID=A0ABN9Y7J3_9DINO|nr:unnamed protein product [Polarella glacialis]
MEQNLQNVQKKVMALLAPMDDPRVTTKQEMATAQQIKRLLLESDFAYEVTEDKEAFAPHPENRYTMGLEPMDVHDLLQLIANKGWCDDAAAGATAFELSEDPQTRAKQLQFQVDLVARSGELLAPSEPHKVKYLTVGGSHTLAGSRCVHHRCKSHVAALCTEDGRLSREKVLAYCPTYAVPLDRGMHFTIIRKEIEQVCPTLPEFLQRAGNAKHGTERQQTQIQLLCQIHQMAIANYQKHGDSRWDYIAREVNKVPSAKGIAIDLCAYVRQWSGGSTAPFLAELKEFASSLTVRREIKGPVWRALASLEFSQGAEYVTSCVKAMMCSPDHFTRDGESTLLASSDIQTIIGKNKVKCIEAACMARAAAAFVKAFPEIPKSDRVKLVASMETRAVMSIHGKKSRCRQHYDTLKGVQVMFLQELYQLHPSARSMDPPFSVDGASRVQAMDSNASASGMREFAGASISVDGAKAMGYTVGCILKPRATDAESKPMVLVNFVGQEVVIRSEFEGDLDFEVKGEPPTPPPTITMSLAKCIDDFKASLF